MELIQGVSGVRGIVNKSFDNQTIIKYIQAFDTLQNKGKILIARDSRPHGKEFIKLGSNELQKYGRDVFNYDIIPTPTAQFIIANNDFAGGIVITASHNPKEWNGLKFIDQDGCFLNEEKNSTLFNLLNQTKIKSNNPGKIKHINFGYKSHVNHTLNLSIINNSLIKSKNIKVVIDAVNGAAAEALPFLLESLGCDVYRLYCEPNGDFQRGTEPLPQNLNHLCKKVVEINADIGFATDPDGDRLAIVNENGIAIGEENTLAICTDYFFKSTSSKKPIVTNLSTTMALDNIAEKYGSYVIRSAVGEINVVNKMKNENALFGGEGNGGIILTESHLGRDSLVGAALFLNYMSQYSRSISKIMENIPNYYIIKDKLNINGIDKNNLFKKIENYYSNIKIDRKDGIKIIWHNAWLHIRKSNTEPILRIYAESYSKHKSKQLIEELKTII